MTDKPLQIYCESAEFDRLSGDEAFQRLVGLARIINSLRFTHGAVAHLSDARTPSSNRQVVSSFLYLAALLFEGLRVTQTLGASFNSLTSFQNGFGKLHADPEVQKLQKELLSRIRNKVVYHLDKDVVPEGLELLAGQQEYVFMSGSDLTNGEVYFDLADEAVVHFIVGEKAGSPEFTTKYTDLLRRTTDLSTRFSAAGDELIAEVLISQGWKTRGEHSPPPAA